MQRVEGLHEGSLAIYDDAEVVGMVSGTVIVHAGTLYLTGAVGGDLIVWGDRAATEVDGAVAGTVRVRLGRAVIRGTVYDTEGAPGRQARDRAWSHRRKPRTHWTMQEQRLQDLLGGMS